jgi:hypothetical protein
MEQAEMTPRWLEQAIGYLSVMVEAPFPAPVLQPPLTSEVQAMFAELAASLRQALAVPEPVLPLERALKALALLEQIQQRLARERAQIRRR